MSQPPRLEAPAAIIFDLDGTLVDSLEDIAHAMNFALHAAGMPTYEVDDYRDFIGHGLPELVRRAMASGGDHEALLAAARARYAAHCLDRTRPYEGVPELLTRTHERGITLAVLSNKPHPLTVRVVEALFADVPFVAVAGDRPEVPRKPNPRAALEIAKAIGVDPRRCWLVGDSAVDLQTARAAAMVGIGVTWGFRPKQELSVEQPHALVDGPAALLALIETPLCSRP